MLQPACFDFVWLIHSGGLGKSKAASMPLRASTLKRKRPPKQQPIALASATEGKAIKSMAGVPKRRGRSPKQQPAALSTASGALAKTASAKMVPAKAAPAKTVPAKTAPAISMARKTASAKMAPAKTAPVKTVPAKTAPAISMATKAMAGRNVPDGVAPQRWEVERILCAKVRAACCVVTSLSGCLDAPRVWLIPIRLHASPSAPMASEIRQKADVRGR